MRLGIEVAVDWLLLRREGPDAQAKRKRQEEIVSKRLRAIQGPGGQLEDLDSAEIAARVGKLSRGTNGG